MKFKNFAVGLSALAAAAGVKAQAPAPVAGKPPSSAPVGPSAQALLERMINVPSAGFTLTGSAVTGQPRLRNDAGVQGGKALRVVVPGAVMVGGQAQPWAVNAVAAITKPVEAGDALMLAFWARLAKADGGATTARIPTAAIQITKEPYSSVIGAPVTIGPEWTLHQVKGRADRNYAAGDLAVSIHLASARQTIDLGPVFVLDLGQAGR